MNKIEKEMVEILIELKEKYGAFEIKAEYENEGSRLDELMRLKEVASKAGLPIILKIGGVEAITDIYSALTLGTHGIVAPMAETPFAVTKFLEAIKIFVPEDNKEDIEFAVNIETITAHDNFEDIINLPDIDLLASFTFGRVDFVKSLGKDRNNIDDEEMFKYCEKVFKLAKSIGKKTALGGAISVNSIDFVKRFVDAGLLDKFETRKVVFNKKALEDPNAAIEKAIEFELCWLKSKRRYYSRIKSEDEKRIEMLDARLNK